MLQQAPLCASALSDLRRASAAVDIILLLPLQAWERPEQYADMLATYEQAFGTLARCAVLSRPELTVSEASAVVDQGSSNS